MGRQFVEHHLEKLQPDVLLVAFGWNDSILFPAPDNDPVYWQKRRFEYSPDFWQENSILRLVLPRIFNDIRRKIAGRGMRHPPSESYRLRGVPKVSLLDFELNLQAIYEWCLQHQVKFVLLTEAAANESKNGAKPVRGLQSYHAVIRQMDMSTGIPLADVDSCIEAEGFQKYYDDAESDYIHLNRLGQLRMAQVVKKTLEVSGCLSR